MPDESGYPNVLAKRLYCDFPEGREFSLLESLLWDGEALFLLDEHLDRLQQSANFFAFEVDRTLIGLRLHDYCSTLPSKPHKVRVLIDQKGRVTCESMAIQPTTLPVVCRLALTPIDSTNHFLYHKTTQRQVYDQALLAVQAIDPECRDVLLWNQQGELTESCRANIVVEKDGDLLTPPIHCGLLSGVFRARLLKQGKIREKVIHSTELPTVQHVWLINSVRKISPAQVNLEL